MYVSYFWKCFKNICVHHLDELREQTIQGGDKGKKRIAKKSSNIGRKG